MRIGNKIYKFPILIGNNDKADKCSVWQKNDGGYSLMICKLKNPSERGKLYDVENIGRVLVHLHFCKLSALKAFAEGLNEMIREWEEENGA